MSNALENSLKFKFSSSVDDKRDVDVIVFKPRLHDAMAAWVCDVCISSDVERKRSFYGATSIQALTSAVTSLEGLLDLFFPEGDLHEEGLPVVFSGAS